jgi:hypothetical protein
VGVAGHGAARQRGPVYQTTHTFDRREQDQRSEPKVVKEAGPRVAQSKAKEPHMVRKRSLGPGIGEEEVL